MSINLYLNNKVRELARFKSTPYPDGSGDKMTINGINLFGDKGRLYLMCSEDFVIPDELKDLVDDVSCYETIPQMAPRESGVYRYESAECELTPEDYGNAKREKPVYKLKIKAKKLEDIQALVHKVKTGTIRPDESYEGPQGGMSRAELERELSLSRKLLLDSCEKLQDMQVLSLNLRYSRWPFCMSKRVAQRIMKILRHK